MSAITTDGAAIVKSGGGFVRWATDRSVYLFGGVDPVTQVAYASAQVIQWCAGSSVASNIVTSLRNSAFAVSQIAGSREFIGECFVFNSSALPVSGTAALSFFEARG